MLQFPDEVYFLLIVKFDLLAILSDNVVMMIQQYRIITLICVPKAKICVLLHMRFESSDCECRSRKRTFNFEENFLQDAKHFWIHYRVENSINKLEGLYCVVLL